MAKIRYRVYLGSNTTERLAPALAAELSQFASVTLSAIDDDCDGCTIELPAREREAVQHELAVHPWVISYTLMTPVEDRYQQTAAEVRALSRKARINSNDLVGQHRHVQFAIACDHWTKCDAGARSLLLHSHPHVASAARLSAGVARKSDVHRGKQETL